MASRRGEEAEFSRDVDSMLSGRKPEASLRPAAEHDADLAFAAKVTDARATPSAAFRSDLKRRLVSRLADLEAKRQAKTNRSVKDLLSGMFGQRTWQVAGAAVAVLVIAALVFWRTGMLSPKGPIVTNPYPTVAIEVYASLDKGSYSVGEDIAIEFSFRNISSDELAFLFPPAFRIETLDAQTIRAFRPGEATRSLQAGDSASYAVTWDQSSTDNLQTGPGQYQIVVPNVKLGDAGFLSLAGAPNIVIVAP